MLDRTPSLALQPTNEAVEAALGEMRIGDARTMELNLWAMLAAANEKDMRPLVIVLEKIAKYGDPNLETEETLNGILEEIIADAQSVLAPFRQEAAQLRQGHRDEDGVWHWHDGKGGPDPEPPRCRKCGRVLDNTSTGFAECRCPAFRQEGSPNE